VSGTVADLRITRCESCHSRFLPRPGPCPRCGATTVVSLRIPPVGRVLAATEALYPPTGWTSPHRLALVAVSEDVRVLALVEGPLPSAGVLVRIERRGEQYVARTPEPEPPATGAPPG
jgi:uncharacterized OB-fold protein